MEKAHMQTERFAFISVYEKDNVEQLAEAACEAGFQIVSLGGTAATIEAQGIPVISSEEFVAEDDNFKVDEESDARENRELIGSHLAQHMCHNPEALHAVGRRVIDLAYINLMPPSIHPATGGFKSDKGGALMISAALEGSRTVLTEPRQIAPFTRFLASGPYSHEAEATNRLLLADEALKYLEFYTARTRELGRAAVQAAQWARIAQS